MEFCKQFWKAESCEIKSWQCLEVTWNWNCEFLGRSCKIGVHEACWESREVNRRFLPTCGADTCRILVTSALPDPLAQFPRCEIDQMTSLQGMDWHEKSGVGSPQLDYTFFHDDMVGELLGTNIGYKFCLQTSWTYLEYQRWWPNLFMHFSHKLCL